MEEKSGLSEKDLKATLWAEIGTNYLKLVELENNPKKNHKLLENALEAFRISVALKPDGVVWHRIGLLCEKFDFRTDAVYAFIRSTKLEPRNTGSFFHLARLYDVCNRLDAAYSTIEHALYLKPKDDTLLTEKGDILVRQDKFEAALKAYEKATELNPKNSDAWRGMCNALIALNRGDEAERANKKAGELLLKHSKGK